MRLRRLLPALLLAPIALITWVGALQLGVEDTRSSLPIPPSIVGQVIDGVSSAELETHICRLQDKDALGYCNTQGTRFSRNPAGLREAADYVAGELEEHSLAVTTQIFTLNGAATEQSASSVLTNVIGTLEGVGPPAERGVVIICAHYDSTAGLTHGWISDTDPAPGADDNASGVSAVLEAARLLSGHRLWHTVRFVAFAGEEQGLHGSRHYANQARAAGENIIAVINLDMIGYESDSDPRLEIHAGLEPRNVALAHAVTETIQAYDLKLFPQPILENAIRLSDHASFWNQSFPAILMIEDTDLRGPTYDFNPHYHTLEDTLDKIDQAYFTEMARAAIGTVTRLARPVGPDLRVNQRGPATAHPGETVTFTLMYSNAGTAPTAGVIVTETLSHGLAYQSDSAEAPRTFGMGGQVSWDLGDLTVGANGRFVVTATVSTEIQDIPSVNSRATIAGTDLDVDGVDNVSILGILVNNQWEVYLPLMAKGRAE